MEGNRKPQGGGSGRYRNTKIHNSFMEWLIRFCYELREIENGEESERVEVKETTMAGGGSNCDFRS